VAGRSWNSQHAGRDSALGQADSDLRVHRRVPWLLNYAARLVGDDGVAAVQDLERAELSELSGEGIEAGMRPGQAQTDELGGCYAGGFESTAGLRETQA